MASKSVHWDDLQAIVERVRQADPAVICDPLGQAWTGDPCLTIVTDRPLLVGYAIATNYGTNHTARDRWASVVAAFGERMVLAAQINPPRGDDAYIISFPGYLVEE